MKIKLAVILTTLFALTLPLNAAATSCSTGDHGHGSHSDHKMMDSHSGMDMHGDMIMLNEEVVDGVKAMVHLKDVSEAMAKMGMKETHHFMIMFTDEKAGKPVEHGKVALKITPPTEKEGKALKLTGMQGHFGTDIALTQKGTYHFTVGTKLMDNKKRKFIFHYMLK